MYKTDLVFANSKLEKMFAQLVVGQPEEIGGILFCKWGQVAGLHWRRQQRLFGDRSFALITDWIVCPNVSNLRDRTYKVSDLEQLIAIAEQTAESRHCMFLHFHSHPNGSYAPSPNDKSFWQSHFSQWGTAKGVIVRPTSTSHCGFEATCHTIEGKSDKTTPGRFLNWRWINYVIRRDEKERAKQK